MVSKMMIAEARKALFDEGLLSEQFEELESLQTPDDPSFVEEIITMFLHDMKDLINQVDKELIQDSPNHLSLDKVLHQIKGTTASVGAKQLSIIGNEMREYIFIGQIHKCRDAFVQFKNQLMLLDQRLGAYFELCKQVVNNDSETGSSASI